MKVLHIDEPDLMDYVLVGKLVATVGSHEDEGVMILGEEIIR